MKTFGLLVPAGKGSTFEKNVLSLLANQDGLHRSCFRCWKPGVAFASAPPNSDASWSGTRARVRLAASLCLFPASVRSPQPPSQQPLRGRTGRAATDSTLRTWGLQLRQRISFKRAAVAVARKLAVIMHTMLKTGELFNPNAGAAA